MYTKLEDMIDPEVLAGMASAELTGGLRLSALANIDLTLSGNPGSTITVPKWNYIGDAETAAEGEDIKEAKLTSSKDTATIKKSGLSVPLTDEAVLSGYGDPIGETMKQIGMAVAGAIDTDLLVALSSTTLTTSPEVLNIDAIDEAQLKFSDEDDSEMVLLVNKKNYLALRKEAAGDWVKASDLGSDILVKGTVGELLGAQVVRYNKLDDNTAYLIKPDALSLYLKTGFNIEPERNAKNQTTLIVGVQHYAAHLANDSKAVKITVTPGA